MPERLACLAPRRRGDRINRRTFIAGLGSAAAWPVISRAQQRQNAPLVGVLNPGFTDPPGLSALYEALHELGYTEGQNIRFERRYADWNPERFPQLASELVRLQVDLIVVMSTSPASAVQKATSTIPIVVSGMADPVGDELIATLARPGANITGNTFLGPELIPKRLGLFKQAVPKLSRLVALLHPNAYGRRTMEGIVKETEVASRATGVELQLVEAFGPDDLERAFSDIASSHSDGMIVMPSPMLYSEHRRIIELASKNRLAAMYAAREFVDAGGLLSYGANLADLGRRTAIYVDRILKGAKPGELPVEQPTKFELLVNLKTARELNLTIPREFLLFVDEVIE
jgi:putative ABC transport system substrate-binding protein